MYNNEKDAEDRFVDFAETYCKDDKIAYETFIEISKQEANHAVLVEKVWEQLKTGDWESFKKKYTGSVTRKNEVVKLYFYVNFLTIHI